MIGVEHFHRFRESGGWLRKLQQMSISKVGRSRSILWETDVRVSRYISRLATMSGCEFMIMIANRKLCWRYFQVKPGVVDEPTKTTWDEERRWERREQRTVGRLFPFLRCGEEEPMGWPEQQQMLLHMENRKGTKDGRGYPSIVYQRLRCK